MSFHYNRFGRGASQQTMTRPLTDDEIFAVAPSVFATSAHESRSDRYTFLPTSAVVAGMRNEGFLPFAVAQAKSRTEGKTEYTKHMLRFRRHDDIANRVASPEVILVNSHDGTSAYQLYAGMITWVCLNGLISATENHGHMAVHHKGNVTHNVIEGSYEILEDSRRTLARAEVWQGITLANDEQLAFAEAAHTLRFPEDSNLREAIRPADLLAARHREQTAPSLHNVYNRVQENVIRGGLTGRARDANNNMRNHTTREVRGISDSVRLNMALHRLAERMAEIKGA